MIFLISFGHLLLEFKNCTWSSSYALGAKFFELVHVVASPCKVWCYLTWCSIFAPLSMFMLTLCVMQVWNTTFEQGENESCSICYNFNPSFSFFKQKLELDCYLGLSFSLPSSSSSPSFSLLSSSSNSNYYYFRFYPWVQTIAAMVSFSSNSSYYCHGLFLLKFELELKLVLP
jgi:hypothetical protein